MAGDDDMTASLDNPSTNVGRLRITGTGTMSELIAHPLTFNVDIKLNSTTAEKEIEVISFLAASTE